MYSLYLTVCACVIFILSLYLEAFYSNVNEYCDRFVHNCFWYDVITVLVTVVEMQIRTKTEKFALYSFCCIY